MAEKEESSDSENFYSAEEDNNTSDERKRKQTEEKKKKEASAEPPPPEIEEPENKEDPPRETVLIKPEDNEKESIPIPPPRRKRKGMLVKQSSAEETSSATKGVDRLTLEDTRRANTFSWPRGERPRVEQEVEVKIESLKGTSNEELPNMETPTTSHEDVREKGEEAKGRVRSSNPSVSIENDVTMELTEELLIKQEVESCDSLPLKAMSFNSGVGGAVGGEYIHVCSEEESVDGDHTDGDQPGATGGDTASGSDRIEPTDSDILGDIIVKNLDTGEQIPLSMADTHIPKGWNYNINPVDSYCQQTAGSWEGDFQDTGDQEGHRRKHKKARVKKLFLRGKKKGEGRVKATPPGSDDEASPEHDHRTLKYKMAPHNKGFLEFEKVRLKQELEHSKSSESRALWAVEFSICGRLLATAGQDSVMKIWVLRNSYHFFHELQVKYARFGIHSSADSLSEKSSMASSQSSEQDDDDKGTFLDQPLCTYTGHTADVLDLSWSKNFFLLSSSMDKTVRLWHISRGECLCCFQHIDFVTSVTFHPRDDRYFLSGSLDGKLRLWNIPDKKVALWNELEGVGSHLITAANFCMNGKLAVVGTYDGRCIFYETEHLKYHTQIHVRSRHGKNRGRKISGIVPLPGEEDKILVTSNDSRIRLYNLQDHSLSCKYKGCLNTSSQIKATFSCDGKCIICGSEDNYIYVWKTQHDYAKLSSVRKDRNDYFECFTAHTSPVTAVCFAPFPGITVGEGVKEIGHVIVAGDYKGTIKVYVTSENL
ncbi:PREDICTED: WD repeat-containing protein 44-like isoform X1 [Amphimedon queenslandica]|uniref:WD repeat-containing protein 44 n=1 Tax=Amphimedon queenslandica TaxID=400682 RepID=A0AAN0JLZ5_AMPQE|nr:PREDICTED: WD repeat-containing protein 44-like isoform X1 [Amphimedon queenslandica]|eukprot:XP_019857784.1 PREDICTED: WD repeat-containing protein 44-like isoform X1 [Amphimedon queenslandica]